jgi:hypothetical protein
MVMKEDEKGRKRPRPLYSEPLAYTLPYYGLFRATDEGTPLPGAYLFPRGLVEIQEKLKQHGIVVKEIKEPFSAVVQAFEIEEYEYASKLYQGHLLGKLKGRWENQEFSFPGGAFLVPTRQPLAMLAAYLLEPESDDGLACWNFFDRYITRGNWDPRPGTYPVMKTEETLP